jgi:glycosyltransferase involved in cell wall biosynthesis
VRPEVIENVPWITDQSHQESVRARIGLRDDQPLMVYSGWIAQERGIDTVIEALVELHGVHLALVAGRTFGYIENLLASAQRLGVANRVHVVGYVEPHEIPGYLSSCDIGLIPLEHAPNHEIAIITKYYEYLHAGLPIVCSDVREMSSLTKRLEVGQVFKAGDVQDFVNSVNAILNSRETYRDRLTPELRVQWSWQEQSKKLVELYS